MRIKLIGATFCVVLLTMLASSYSPKRGSKISKPVWSEAGTEWKSVHSLHSRLQAIAPDLGANLSLEEFLQEMGEIVPSIAILIPLSKMS